MSPVIRSFSSELFSLLCSRTASPSGSLRALSVPLSGRITTTATRSALRTTAPLTLSRAPATPGLRLQPFSTSACLSKKKDKGGKPSKDSDSGSSSGGGKGGAAAAGGEEEVEASFAQLETDIANAVQRLKDDVSKLRAGGRLNPEAIEGLRVAVNKGSKETVRLGELAQVIPKGGRMLTILVGEEEYIKPLTSALLSSNLSLNPQADPHNHLQLNVPIPPPTKESREQSVKDAKAAMEKAANAVRNARGAINKKLKSMKNLRPDDLRKETKRMESVAERGQKEVKEVFEGAKRGLER
ncbi:hypothetical protein AJ79_03823 [Helicocarpus griseus UAMH5409]|uniref:Ribosome recycling factor domain-containing protein n=1 Tax=Helicocarpus griseus UAMH5409 TaxID=1447875 RepID=A0A2B7XV85_9EURO|nr:hypothetical protein AJ79_03823 [Helicocarpus griseus UAMH5409]